MTQSFFLAADSGLAGMAKSTAEQFGVNTSLFVSQVISFLIVAGLLYKFAYKPVLAILEERRQRIAEGMANAEKMKQELASAQAKAQELINQANAQGNKLIEEARASASKVLEAETQKAIAAANDIIAKAKLANESELARMKAELRREMGRLVVSAAAQVTGKILSADDQQRLAEETNRQLAA